MVNANSQVTQSFAQPPGNLGKFLRPAFFVINNQVFRVRHSCFPLHLILTNNFVSDDSYHRPEGMVCIRQQGDLQIFNRKIS